MVQTASKENGERNLRRRTYKERNREAKRGRKKEEKNRIKREI